MEANTEGMSIKMVKKKELEYKYGLIVISKEESGIRVNYMVLPRLHLKMVTLIGGNARMVSMKDMEHLSLLMERDTLGSGCRVTCTGMEYTDGKMELYIKDNTNKVKVKVMHIAGGQVVKSIMDSTRMIRYTEREFPKRMVSYTESNMKKASV